MVVYFKITILLIHLIDIMQGKILYFLKIVNNIIIKCIKNII